MVNSVALKLAGIDKTTGSPFGGEISKDKQTGEPNGMLLDAAKGLVHLPATTPADAERAIVLGAKRDVEHGWTQVQDAGGTYEDVELYKKLYGGQKIKLRVYKAVYGPTANSVKLLHDGPITGAFDNRFNVRTIKVVFDGALWIARRSTARTLFGCARNRGLSDHEGRRIAADA